MPGEDLLALLDKYIAGDCTVEERRRIEDWIQTMTRDDATWAAMTRDEQQKYLKTLYQDILQKIRIPDGSNDLTANIINMPRHRRFRITLAVASILVLAALGGILYQKNVLRHRRAMMETFVTESAQIGQVLKITLPDSTHIWLNAASKLRYPQRFANHKREVYLNGEAFFDVAKDTKRPFVIHTGGMETTVLGTRFNLSGYATDDAFRVAVVSGKVAVGLVSDKNKTSKTVVQANQLITYSVASGELSKENIPDAADYAAWRTGTLAFHHTNLSAAVRQLQRVYHFQFTIDNKEAGEYQISGHFNIHQPAAQVIKAICLSIGAHYEIHDTHVIIKGPENN